MRLEVASICFVDKKPYKAFRRAWVSEKLPEGSRVHYIPHRFKHGQDLSQMSWNELSEGIDFKRMFRIKKSEQIVKTLVDWYIN